MALRSEVTGLAVFDSSTVSFFVSIVLPIYTLKAYMPNRKIRTKKNMILCIFLTFCMID